MANGVYRIHQREEYEKAGATDLVELLPAPDRNPLFIPRMVLEALASGVTRGEYIHLSGPTGSAKSALIEALANVPANFMTVCTYLGLTPKPLKLYPIEMATYETPGELWGRRSLRNNETYDEPSLLVKALMSAAKNSEEYQLIHLREIGRTMNAGIQGGLLNLMTRGDVTLPSGERINTRGVAWIADSNYQAERDCTHTLVTFDDALKRRFTVNLTLDYLSPVQEAYALCYIMEREYGRARVSADLIRKVVKLGMEIRGCRQEGQLQSIPPVTIYGHLAFLRMALFMPQLSYGQIAAMTVLGNASREDEKYVSAVIGKVFGVQGDSKESETVPGVL